MNIMYIYPPHPDEIYHYGIKRRSGRYPYGSGDRPYQDREKQKGYDGELFRFSGKNEMGIYEELKQQLTKTENGRKIWKNFLSSEASKWLPKPPDGTYDKDKYVKYESYFTKDGYKNFVEKTLSFFENKFDKNSIKVEKTNASEKNIGDVVYRDDYQIVYGFGKRSLKHSKESGVNFKMNNIYYLSHGGPGSGRYPLGSGERPYQKFEGSRRKGSGISGYIKSRKAKKAEAQSQKAKEQAQKLADEEMKRKAAKAADKERVLKEGTPKEVSQYKGELTKQELQEVYSRLNLERLIDQMTPKEKKTAWDAVRKVANEVRETTEWVTVGIVAYNTFASIWNSVGDNRNLPVIKLTKK